MGQKESKFSFSKQYSSKEYYEKKHKYFSIFFADISTEFNIKTCPGIDFDDFQKDFNKFFKIPESLNLKLDPKNNCFIMKTPDTEKKYLTLEEIFNEKVINSMGIPQMNISFSDSKESLLDLEILMIKNQGIEYLSFKTFLFFPLKFFLPQEYFREFRCKLFRNTDSLFSDPLDIEKNLLYYNINERKTILLAYFPIQNDFLQISIFYKGNLYPKHVEKFLRIGELQESFNKENNSFVVFCNKESGLRVDDKTTLQQVSKNNLSIIFIAEDIEDYYRNVNVATEKPVFEIISNINNKKNKNLSIDLPD